MDALTVETGSGPVRGSVACAGVRKWMGIPFARAPRFAAPEPHPGWSDVRDATRAGPQCPQMFGSKAKRARMAEPDFSEECLSLNIYAPATQGDEKLPVYVWIHGGAFLAGGGAAYDGSLMAQTGHCLVVTINYRLGVLGFVDFGDALGLPDIPSNLGLGDQIAALRWVRDNIAAFGGDPEKVTIGGQSAGSMSVSLLMLAQGAWPLFRGAIMQSGAVSLIHSRETAQRIARRYAELLDLNQGDLEKLRTMPLRRLFEAQGTVDAETPGGIPAAPWYDGDLLPESLAAAQAAPTAPVPLIAGAAREESRLFELMPGSILPTRRAEVAERLTGGLGEAAAGEILAAYPDNKAGNRALASDFSFGMPTRNFAERHAAHQPTWFYRFDYSHPIAGATHGLDLTLTWPMKGLRAALARGGPMKGKRAALGGRMIDHYAHFVRDLTPVLPRGAEWPQYRPNERKVKIFALADRVETDPDAERVAAWAGRDVGSRG
ncbi:carboxylesterase/lipase family protein [Stakelama tenebrarum]|uniref:Carboxylic ester hydrolase n=1 Tax=Stakelama tenebrarum TaxID=2711215 RepID=A0A6G6Y7B2_9SPHN|nr:carboxylesterase family protein [Sphingosinithalassobacter tenebrarum]QIG80799.1 carboxylesterase/lipase family protein [Sphingosinithalassobacter tenebrarum]